VRRGVILFGLEFGSTRWACIPYCEFLRQAGFDIFSFEFRSHGQSAVQPGYEPLPWVTDFELADFRAALAYLRGRPDADARGVGLFGLSKGGTAGLSAAADDPYIRCFVTDGVYATHLTMKAYMSQWLPIYKKSFLLRKFVPWWYYGRIASKALALIQQQRGCRYAHLERAMPRLGARALLMIHGGADTYIKPEMARALFDTVRGPKEFWLVDGAKHNQAIHVANGEYQQRVLAFFQRHLAADSPTTATTITSSS
jgi:pimeloyl-ACP methyl ester carboxylesterase